MLKAVSKHIYIPLREKLAGHSTIKRLTELEKTQWMSPEQLRELQAERLRALVKHAYHSVPYYHRVFEERGLEPEDIRTTEDLKKLPILTREDRRNNFSDLIARNYSPKQMRLTSTSGSTGEPLSSYHPRDIGWTWGALWRGMRWYGVDMGDKYASIFRAHPTATTMIARLRLRLGQMLIRQISHTAFEMTPEGIEHFVRWLRKFKPRYIAGLPSALYLLSGYIVKQGISDIKPKVVITTAEKLYDYQKEAIRQAFGCDVFEYYGGDEVGSIAYECPEHNGLHITAENVVIEIAKDGKNVPPGELGAVLATDLHNYAMPFIRYQNGDVGILSDKICPCGRGLPLMESVEGRIGDIIVTENGFLPPIMNDIFRDTHAKQFQVIQESKQLIRIKVIKGEGYSQRDTDYIVGILSRYLGERVKIELEFVDTIPLTPSGKYMIVISKVPVQF